MLSFTETSALLIFYDEVDHQKRDDHFLQRFPGVISYDSHPGGGTTDYAGLVGELSKSFLSHSYLSFPSTFPFFSANLPRRLDNGCAQVLPKARYQAIFFIILKHDNNDNNNRLPMMYLDDCLRSTVEFMLAPPETLSTRFFFINNEDGMKRSPS